MTVKVTNLSKYCEKLVQDFVSLVFYEQVTELFTNFLKYKRPNKFEKVLNLGKTYLIHPQDHIKVNESYYKQCGVAAHFSTGQNL